MGHGHVIPNANGVKARCGGPAICPDCKQEAEQYRRQIETFDTLFVCAELIPIRPTPDNAKRHSATPRETE